MIARPIVNSGSKKRPFGLQNDVAHKTILWIIIWSVSNSSLKRFASSVKHTIDIPQLIDHGVVAERDEREKIESDIYLMSARVH